MQHPTDRITHTTALVTPVVGHWLEREIALKDRSDDPSHHERTLLPRSYISLLYERKTAVFTMNVVPRGSMWGGRYSHTRGSTWGGALFSHTRQYVG